MAAQVSVRSASRWWGVIVSALVIFLAQGSLVAQRSSARYVGGTLDAPPNVIRYRCKAPKVTLDLTSDSNLLVGGDQKKALTLGYDSISLLKYGLETVKGALCYPWDSSEQFTKNKHYLLTMFFRDSSDHEQALVLELDKAMVRPTLARLEARTGKRVEFTNAVACVQHKTVEECGHGQPSELKGLTKVFIDSIRG
jgi:hypothetical protein